MADYSPDDAAYAARIVGRLMALDTEGLDLGPDLVVSDVEADANSFSEDLSLLEEVGGDMPAVVIAGEPIPVSLAFVVGRLAAWPILPPFARSRRRHPFWHELMYDYLRDFRRKDSLLNDGFTSINHDDARSTFSRRATDFIATRLAGIRAFRNIEGDRTQNRSSLLNLRQRLRGPQVVTPGCQFTVATNSAGLRVFWSGAYYVTPNYFSHPTSPTSSVLQSGVFVFGIDGGAYGSTIQWDRNAVVSLPGLPYVHLNY